MSERLISKLTLEAELARPVTQVLGGYVSTWEKAEGNVPFIKRFEFQSALRHALERHYARVVSVTLGENPTPQTTIGSVALSMAHGERLRARAQSRALYMITAIDRDLSSILGAAIAMEMASPTWTKMADLAVELKADKPQVGATTGFGSRLQATAAMAYRKLRAKLRTLVNVETQETAEESIFEWVRQKRPNAEVVKVWHTMGDERVRHSHVDAGERYGVFSAIPVAQPFQLAGGQLLFPGDTSLGVSMTEIYNCRCHLEYFTRVAGGVMIPLGLRTPTIPARRPWRPGDRFGEEIPIRATELVTLNGKTRARVVLGDNRTIATMAQVSPSTINVSVNGEVVARATHARGQVASLRIADGREGLGIERLIRDSVAHSWARQSR